MRITSVVLSLAFIGCGGPPQSARSPAWVEDTSELGIPPGAKRILVTPETNCPNRENCDILEVLDIHTRATSQDKGFDQLRARAVAIGGDAVIGAEFEHGDGNEPSHLSGMIVRFGRPVPPHVALGMIDIPSDEDNEDKGLEELSRRAHQMGGNQVIDVTFEHGEDGAQGHLRGTVIKYTE